MATDPITFPARRAAAERNREKILTAARSAFAEGDASMAEIARRAGVGMATLYRNFPGRRELLEALYIDEVNAICDAAETSGGETPADRLEAWLYGFFRFLNSKHQVAELLKRTSDNPAPFLNANASRVLGAGLPLLRAAQQAGEVRDDLTLEQVVQMVVAIATIADDLAHVEPILQTALDGLRCSPRQTFDNTSPREAGQSASVTGRLLTQIRAISARGRSGGVDCSCDATSAADLPGWEDCPESSQPIDRCDAVPPLV